MGDVPRGTSLHKYTSLLYIYARPGSSHRYRGRNGNETQMKQQRHTVIREVLAEGPIASQDDLRRKLAGRGFHVTQATLSRDIHELRLSKGPDGYSLSNGGDAEEDSLPGIREVLGGFGLEVRQA